MDSEFTTDDTVIRFTMPMEDFLDLVKERNRMREALQEIADAKISGVIDDGYNVRDWLIKHHVMLVNKARAALKEGE